MRNWMLIFSLVALVMPANSQADETAKQAVAGLVRTLGYGGAIHNFKNYVLRGDEKYQKAADKKFSQSKNLVKKLAETKGLTNGEIAALETIKNLVSEYQANLAEVGNLRKQGKTVEAIDEAVTVDDTAAIQALELLRDKHNWNDVENLEFHIGYGTGIHNFKNFVLRADEKYRARASLGLSKVLLIVARFRASDKVTAAQTESLDQIEKVVRSYEEALPKVQELVGEGKTASEIDNSVKVDDSPALKALAELRN